MRGTEDSDKEEEGSNSNMSGTFRNLHMITLLAVSLASVMVQRAEGYPREWENVFSYGDTKEPTTRGGASSVIPYERFWSAYNDQNGNPHVIEGLASRRAQDNEDDANGDDFNDEYSDEYSDEDVDEDDDAIAQGIMQAVTDGIFLSPEEWAETLPDKPFEMPNNQAETGISSFGDNIVFPDSLPNPKPEKLVSRPVPKCKGSTFCLKPSHYPSNAEIEDALKKSFLPPVVEPPSIAERISPTYESLCLSREHVILPKTGLTDSEQWEWIVNTSNFEQTVKVEFCETENSPCKVINNIVADGYKTFCKQKYVYRNLVALGENGTVLKPFKMPSSCCCYVKFVGNPMLRMSPSLKQSPVQDGTGN